jgi:hypothetical protein
MVGAEGFEPPALCSQSRCATRLRYAPTLFDCNADWLPIGFDAAIFRVARARPETTQERDGDGENQRKIRGQQQQKRPVAPSVPARLAQVAAEQAIVAAVRVSVGTRGAERSYSMLQSLYTAAIVQWQNACLWHRMSRVRSPLAAPVFHGPRRQTPLFPSSGDPEIPYKQSGWRRRFRAAGVAYAL